MESHSAVEERYWRAIIEKDAAFDGVFVLGVRSTGVYCRPTCPSRRPNPERVAFFATPSAAEASGFRACLRCEPRREGPSRRQRMIQEACRLLDFGEEESPTLAWLSARLKVSSYHLQRTFKRALGVTPRQYAEARRLRRLKGQLREGEPVTRAMYDAGYGSSSRLYETSSERLGMTPGAYGLGGRGMRVAYLLTDSPLGRLLVAATERGVCAVSISDSDAELIAALHREYPAAEIVDWTGDERAGLALWAELLAQQLDGRQPVADLPLDVQVTAFQARVYQALRAIPLGQTRSYSEIAREIGRPTAVRAVARACATNPTPITVPCHRVVRSNGDLGGYGLGVERKRRLLEIERASTARPKSNGEG